MIDKGILEEGFDDESQVTPVVFRILQDTTDLEIFLYQVSQKRMFSEGDFSSKHLAYSSEIVRQSETIFGGGNAMSNLMSGKATLEYLTEKTNKPTDEIFTDSTMIPFIKTIRGEVAHNPWLLHDGGQYDSFNMDDVYLGITVLNRLFYEIGPEIYGSAINRIFNIEMFNTYIEIIRERQKSLGWEYNSGWQKIND